MKRPESSGTQCDTITSPRRLVNTFIHQMIPDLLKRDKPIKVAINFKSWSVTLTRSPFSEKQQISKGEYKRTQQPTFTRGMGKSDIMHGICGTQDICRNSNILCRVVFEKHFVFCKAHPLQKEQEVFQ
jgi:hypothetical protein